MAENVRLDKSVLDNILRIAPQKAADAVESTAREGQAYVMSSFGKDGSPSSPGGVPGIDLGNLKASIEVQPTGELQRAITANTDYALPLEVGTSKMAARPFMLPMSVWLQGRIPDIFEHFLE
jgi:hypothetical protein